MITPIWSRALLSEKISFEEVSMVLRVENCIVSYVKYIGKLLYPENLAIIYPYPQRIPVYLFALALICLLAVSVFVLMNIKKRAYLFMGWFFFLGVLFPFTGLVQGALWPEMADRFVYIPQIGIYLAVIFLGLDYAKKYQKQNVFVITACLMTLYYISTTWNQIETWRNSESLFRHAIEKTENNYIAYNNYGTALEDSGNLSDAESMFKKSLEIKNDFWKAHYNLGTHYLKLKQSEKALDHFESVIKNNDKVYRAYYNAGILLMQKNENERAKKYFQKAIAVKPDFSEALNNLGLLFFYKGQLKIAADYFAGAINAEPSNTGALCNMGNLLVEKGQLRTAIECFNKVLEYEKNNSCALQGLDTVLSVPLSVIRGKKDYNGLLDMGND
jgi:tetratricopeptide (TPR) repeat protein